MLNRVSWRDDSVKLGLPIGFIRSKIAFASSRGIRSLISFMIDVEKRGFGGRLKAYLGRNECQPFGQVLI